MAGAWNQTKTDPLSQTTHSHSNKSETSPYNPYAEWCSLSRLELEFVYKNRVYSVDSYGSDAASSQSRTNVQFVPSDQKSLIVSRLNSIEDGTDNGPSSVVGIIHSSGKPLL